MAKKKSWTWLKKCPKCGEETGIPIIWRTVAGKSIDDDLKKLVDGGRAWVDETSVGDSTRHCTKCGWEWDGSSRSKDKKTGK